MSLALSFVDTNVLLYGIDSSDLRKQRIAVDLIEQLGRSKTGVLSTQVLLEFASNLTRKFKVSRTNASVLASAYTQWQIVASDVPLILQALARSAENKLSIWDAMVVEAAVRAEAQTLYTEDLTHGQRFGPLTVVNPFLT